MILYFILKTVLSGIIFIYLSYFIGHVLYRLLFSNFIFGLKQQEFIFFKVTLGLFFSIFLIATFLTYGKTSFMVPFIGIIISALLFFRKGDSKPLKIEEDDLQMEIKLFSKVLLIIFPITWLFVFWTSYSFENFPFFNLSRDDIFYAQVAHHIREFGMENQFLSWDKESFKLGIVPYHYFDAYLINLFSFTGLLGNQILLFIGFSVLSSTVTLGFLSFADKRGFNLVLSLFVPIIVTRIFYYDFKNLSYIIIAILTSVLYLNGLKKQALVSLLLFPVINFGQLPLLLIFLGTLSIYLLILKEYSYFKWVLVVMFLTLLYFIPSKIISSSSAFASNSSLSINSITNYYLSDLSTVKTSLHISISLLLETILKHMYLSILLLLTSIWVLVYSKSSIYKSWIYILLVLLCLSLAASGILSFIAETAQIFYLLYTFLMIVPILILLHFFSEKRVLNYVFLIWGLYLVWSAYSNSNPKNNKLYFELEKYSTRYLREISAQVVNLVGVGGRFINPKVTSVYGVHSDCHVEGYQLTYLRDGLNIHTLNVLDIEPQKSLHNFFNYNKSLIVKSNYLNNEFNSICKTNWEFLSQSEKNEFYLRFIKEHHINYIFVNKEANVPDEVVALFKHKIEDSKSGEYLLFNDRIR